MTKKAKPAAATHIATAAGDFAEIAHSAIRPDPANPRKVFDEDGLAELAASIAADGLLEPLVVREIEPGDFMLIAGERRWRAIGQAIAGGAWPAERLVPAMIRQVSEQDARRLALIENLQRRDLNPIEEARAIEALAELTGASAAQLGRDLGFSERWAQQRLALLKLPKAMQGRVDRGELKVEDARQAAALLPKLPPIKAAELERGKITFGEARAWLDAQPQPLSDAAKLAIMELLEKVAAEPYAPNPYTTQKGAKVAGETVRVDNGPNGVRVTVKVQDPKGGLAELEKRRIVEGARPVLVETIETGEHFVMLGYSADWELRQVFPSAQDPAFRKSAIPTLRVQVYGLQADYDAAAGGGYATPWLNAPALTLPAEVEAQIAAKRAEREANEARHAEQRKAEDAARARQAQAYVEAFETAQRREAEIAQAAAADRPEQLLALALEAGAPLPWSLDDSGNLRDAGGKVFHASGGYWLGPDRKAVLRLVVAIANAGAGLSLPTPGAGAEADLDGQRLQFLGDVAQLLEDLDQDLDPSAADAKAEAGLAAFLAQEGIAFGDDEYDWEDAGAQQLAHLIHVEGLGQQVDLEDAVAAAGEQDVDDDEITDPRLLALAGVKVST